MDSVATASSGSNGESTLHDLFALTDEQILEIEPEAAEPGVPGPASPAFSPRTANSSHQSGVGATLGSPGADGGEVSAGGASPAPTGAPSIGAPQQSLIVGHTSAEPPPWLAAQMKDPWTGQEALELWNGVQQAKSEAAAYRAAFATPEDARALKELYPGGVNEARTAAERARVLDDIDRAYFGTAGSTAEQTSAARAQLAQKMLREDPAAFREMVFAGLRALEASGVQASSGAGVGARFSATHLTESTAPPTAGATQGSPLQGGGTTAGGASLPGQAGPAAAPSSVPGAPAAAGAPVGNASAHEAHVAAYAAFEKAANDDLERSVGGAIARTLEQALPNLSRSNEGSSVGARYIVPLQGRLSAAVRQDVEAALKGDRQLGEQIAQILSARRFDNETRAQIVRLIGERAQQLVPGATKRVLNEWTQATLASHRSSTAKADAAATRREVTPVSSEPPRGVPANTRATPARPSRNDVAKSQPGRVDYRKLSDEQILDL